MQATRIASLGIIMAAAVTPLAAQQDWDDLSAPGTSFGAGAEPASGFLVGQTFLASGSTLDAFGFYAASNWSGNATFQAFLFGMTGNAVTGSALYASAPMAYGSITTGWFDFFTGGVGLTPGQVYMAILAPTTVSSGVAIMDIGAHLGDLYPGMGAYSMWATWPLDDAQLQGGTWNAMPGDYALRLAYAEETFDLQGAELDNLPTTTTPEPATLALLATGLVGLGAAARARRRRDAV